MKRLRIEVLGYVQGVGFRYSTQFLAQELKLSGTVQNLDNGNVLIEVQGEEAVLDEFLRLLPKRQSRFARIDHLYVTQIARQEESGFRVIY